MEKLPRTKGRALAKQGLQQCDKHYLLTKSGILMQPLSQMHMICLNQPGLHKTISLSEVMVLPYTCNLFLHQRNKTHGKLITKLTLFQRKARRRQTHICHKSNSHHCNITQAYSCLLLPCKSTAGISREKSTA